MRLAITLASLMICAPIGSDAWALFGGGKKDTEEKGLRGSGSKTGADEIEEIEADVEAAEIDEMEVEALLTDVEAEDAAELEAEEDGKEDASGSPKGKALGYAKKGTVTNEEVEEMIDEAEEAGEVETSGGGKALALGHAKKVQATDEEVDEMIDEAAEAGEIETSSRGKALGHVKQEVKGKEGGYSYAYAKGKDEEDKKEELASVLDELEQTQAAIDKLEAAKGGKKGGYSYTSSQAKPVRKGASHGQGKKKSP